jgi:phage terminase large subunit-like protein
VGAPANSSLLSKSNLLLLKAHLSKRLQLLDSQERLTSYRPYPKQIEFHAAGTGFRERMLMAGNQLGKTLAAANETAMHLTGLYPEWWQGKRFDKAVRWLAGSESAELTRKGVQRLLLGPPENQGEWGTAAIPKATLIGWTRRAGVADAVASMTVRHRSGDVSSVQLATYDQGRTKWQADTVDGIWFDEEPPEDIYFEGLTRTNAVMGPVYTTLTPLLGISNVVKRFYLEQRTDTHLTMMTIEDVEHYTPEQRAAIVASYPAFERDARTKGIPQLGSGRVFSVNDDDLKVDAFPIPAHWPQIGGLDFGWDHPSAAVRLAWDRDNDVLYVTACHRAREQTPVLFAASVKPWGAWLPWAWPHDGLQHDKGSGAELASQYRGQGLNLLKVHATFEDGSNGLEAGVSEMLGRMQTGRLMVFSHLAAWFEEFNLYHRKEGLIVKLNDDLLSATRYAQMMKRFATVEAKKMPPKSTGSVRGPARGDGYGWMGG